MAKRLQELEKELKTAAEKYRQRPDKATALAVMQLLVRLPASEEAWRRAEIGDIDENKLRSYLRCML